MPCSRTFCPSSLSLFYPISMGNGLYFCGFDSNHMLMNIQYICNSLQLWCLSEINSSVSMDGLEALLKCSTMKLKPSFAPPSPTASIWSFSAFANPWRTSRSTYRPMPATLKFSCPLFPPSLKPTHRRQNPCTTEPSFLKWSLYFHSHVARPAETTVLSE